ncbi:hypothetical protein OGATHE_005887 [Ogataea polymorpha]|uniref:Secreted protein n=1 Tax=Ogataea polymorpha TaxID=460523 RepID=A0A9P8NUY6_9ASCO|nr:hypothetical protein OGATHE_005887 [Ogataea polymorpha]
MVFQWAFLLIISSPLSLETSGMAPRRSCSGKTLSALDEVTYFDSGSSITESRTSVLSTERPAARYQKGDVFLFQKSGHRTRPCELNGSEVKMDSSRDLMSSVSLSRSSTFW